MSDVEQIDKIPHLEVENYGNQETFLIMLQTILNATIDMVNILAQREHEREVREGKHQIIVATSTDLRS